MHKSPPERYQAQVFGRIMALISPDIINWVQKRFTEEDFSDKTIAQLKMFEANYQENQTIFEKNIEKGIRSNLPPSNIYAASKFSFEEKIHLPLNDVNFGMVFDESENLKGYQVTVEGIPLDEWCAQNGLNPEDYLLILQIYFEDQLEQLGIFYDNGQFKNINQANQTVSPQNLFDLLQKDSQQEKMTQELTQKRLMKEGKKLQFHFDIVREEAKPLLSGEQTISGPTSG